MHPSGLVEGKLKARRNRSLLANQIVDLIVMLRLTKGHHLTEQFLANELQVSRTPVRAALKLLEQQGIVVSRTNQGYFLDRAWPDVGHMSIEVPATAEQGLYAAIIRDRLTGELPEKMTQKELEDRYDTNRNTLLRVLSRLADEGLVDRSRGRGWRFMPTLEGRIALRDSYNFRITIEPASFAMPTFAVDKSQVSRSQASHEFILSGKNLGSVSALALFDLNSDFHEMIARFSSNSFLINAIQYQNRMRRTLEFHTYVNSQRVRDWLREHLEVLSALERDDRQAAAAAMKRHLTNAAAGFGT